MPVDVIMYAFHVLQRFYLREISRGEVGLGNYSLLSKYEDKRIEIEEICKFQVCFPEKITESLKNRKLDASEIERNQQGPSDMRVMRAQEIIYAGGISFIL